MTETDPQEPPFRLFYDGNTEPLLALNTGTVASVFRQTRYSEPGDTSRNDRLRAFLAVFYPGGRMSYTVGDFDQLLLACRQRA